uniref:Tumor necrosis factor alpha-induced protein 2 n=1 Tax=Nomascus leucogenys TaxID=61853 RepID=G1S1Y0_NOMLE
MSEASSEDLVPPLEAGAAPYREEEEAAKKKKEKKKSKGLANVFCVFTKGKKKKGQPSSTEPEGAAGSRQGLDGPPPTGALGPWAAPERLRQALAVVAEQEREDRQAAAAGPRGLAATRPRRWLQMWRRGVAEAAEERLGRQPAAGAEVPESVFLHLGRTMKEDLEAVVERLKPLFPAEFGVVAAYAESYHQHFAAHLAAMAQFELCERDTYMLLVWVQNLYPNDIINSPKLVGELQGMGLGSLLPPRQIRLLEATFLSNEAANVRELMDRALELEAQRWAEDVPPQILDGHCHSELAIDIIQIISQAQAKAESITLDLGSQIKQVLLLVELPAFLRRWVSSAGPLGELKGHGFDTCSSTAGGLKPLFKRFTHTRWAAPVETLEKIIATVDTRLPEFSELQDCFREELMEALHLHLVKEYIIQLSKRGLVLKTAEQQQQLARHILANADTIQHFCTQLGSPATWLQPALPTLAEIIRLQDPSAIKIEVATYVTCYPDFSKGHLSAILAIKGNLSNSEVKSIRSILDVSTGAQEPSRPLFSLIKVG